MYVCDVLCGFLSTQRMAPGWYVLHSEQMRRSRTGAIYMICTVIGGRQEALPVRAIISYSVDGSKCKATGIGPLWHLWSFTRLTGCPTKLD